MTVLQNKIGTAVSEADYNGYTGSNISGRIVPESKNDFLTGMYLIVRIDEKDVDINALNTIQDDCPEFILPFNYKNINGQTEFTYKVGSLNKLQYFYGEVSHTEYITLWKCILSPLLECRDWFMRPDAFILDADYLYYDKEKNNIAYVYIPILRGCSGYDCFTEMAIKVARGIKVNDAALENKVLRSIIDNFKPDEFLKMLLHHNDNTIGRYSQTSCLPADIQKNNAHEVLQEISRADTTKDETSDIYSISLDPVTDVQTGESEMKYAENAANSNGKEYSGDQTKAKDNKRKIFGCRKKKIKETKRNGFTNKIPDNLPVEIPAVPVEIADNTQETKESTGETRLRYIGHSHHPAMIDVDIIEGGIFTIGRYDVNIGRKRSSFEFDGKTKAVSRRHAAIERNGAVYSIVDLSSSAGTYIDDKKLVPSTPLELLPGNRVSFGNMGADYVWEIS